jgi:hypothetical protein
MPRIAAFKRPFHLTFAGGVVLPFAQYFGPAKPFVPIFKN